ncbi:MAG TPA: extracellular solute-binding protein [Solirubrobacteraceae bacterium]|nr:extracellular solute-binding protein [Solirubrobacteraceae bacterium]
MKFNIRATRSIRLAVVAASVLAMTVGLASNAAAKKSSVVHISVVSLIPGSTQAAFNEFDNKVAQFEAANPGIAVRGVQYQWLPATFAAKLASGTLPTVFTVPFTDGRSLGDNGQLANLTKYAKAEPYYKDFNPSVIAEGIDSKKQVIAIPTAAYAQALNYNRQLFSEAGLNPNKPPTTWAQLEADAKQISQRTGKTGYSEMGASDNTAGWILTTVTDALGGRMETGIGTHAKATFDNPQAVQALNILKQMRWSDHSMGANFGLSWGTSNQSFAAGQIGMFISGSDVYTNMVQADNINPSIYGLAPIPLAKSKTAGVLGGGTLAAVSPKSSPAQINAAMKWISFYYVDKLINRKAAIQDAKTLIKNKQPVGVPELPVFNQAVYNRNQRWIKPYINVPESQFAPFNKGIFKEHVIPEPESATQAIYGDLDSAVQAVFANQGANSSQLLAAANSTGQASIASGG